MKKPQDNFITFLGRKGSGKHDFHQYLSAFHAEAFVELDIRLEMNSKVDRMNLVHSIFSGNTGHFFAIIISEINTSAKKMSNLRIQTTTVYSKLLCL